MTKTILTRERMPAPLQDDNALRALMPTTVREMRETEMPKLIGSATAERTASAVAGG